MHENAVELLEDSYNDMIAMMDVLRTLGVDPAYACMFTSSLIKDAARCRYLFHRLSSSPGFVGAVTGHVQTFVEVHGAGRILDASHNIRRNHNVFGLDAIDL